MQLVTKHLSSLFIFHQIFVPVTFLQGVEDTHANY